MSSNAQLRRRLTATVLVPFLMLSLVTALLSWRVHRLLELSRWVEHTDQVIAAANRAERSAIEQQSSVDAFELTADKQFAEAFEKARVDLDGQYVNLARLVADNPAQVASLQSLRAEHEAWTATMLPVLTGDNGDEPLLRHVHTRSVLDGFERFLGVEADLRVKRAARAEKETRAMLFFAFGGTVVAAAALALAGRKQIRDVSSQYDAMLVTIEKRSAALERALKDRDASLKRLEASREETLQSEARYRRLADELEQRVEQRTTELSDANRALEGFAQTVAHDLRAPIRGVQGFAGALVEDYGDRLDEVGRTYIERIIGSAEAMDQLIRDLLAFSKLRKAVLPKQAVSLDAVVVQVLQTIQPLLKDSGAEIGVRSPLGDVLAHPPTLAQIVQNLLENAVKFVKPTTRPRIEVYTDVTAEGVRLFVHDEGIGIDEKHHRQIFHVFERLHGQEAYPGTGIGLAIVEQAAHRMGGKVGVDSKLGGGATFWVQLPKVDDGRRDEQSHSIG